MEKEKLTPKDIQEIYINLVEILTKLIKSKK